MVILVIYLQMIYKTVIVFLAILLIIRALGKRELGELSIFDLVVLLLIADIGAVGVEDETLFLPSIACLFAILVLQKTFSIILLRFSALRVFFDGNPTIVVEEGKLNLKAMKKELYTVDDLITQMRINQIMDIKEIKLAILETSGDLSVFSYKRYDKITLPVIASGKICKNMLPYLKLEKNDIIKMARAKGYEISSIFYASSDGTDLFIADIL